VLRALVGLRERARALFGRRFESELDEELRFHLEEATARNVRRGMSPEAARQAAKQSFGSVQVTKERVRGETGVRLLQDLAHDLKHALRGLRQRPGVAVIVVLTVAICIGANGAVFSVVHSIVLKPLPFPESDRLVRIFNSYPAAGIARGTNSVPDRYDRRDFIEALEDVALYTQRSFTLGGEDGGRHTFSLNVTPSFFAVLRVAPAMGRVFDEAIEVADGPRPVVIGHELWVSQFGNDPAIIGKDAMLDGELRPIIGVLPESFRFSTWDAQIFSPLIFTPAERSDQARHAEGYEMIGRLMPGATVGAAQAEIDAFNQAAVSAYPADTRTLVMDAGYHTVVRSYLADLTRDVRRPFLLMWAGVLLVMVIAIANVTGILLVRVRARQGELATRMALGAGRARILRQLVTESTVMSLLGGAIGLVLAWWSLPLLGAFEVYEIPRADDVTMGPVVIIAMGVAALLLGLIAGLVPAILLGGRKRSLLQGHRGEVTVGAPLMQRALVSGQIALAFILIMGAGLLVASLRNLTAIDPGFDATGVIVNAISLPYHRYGTPEARLEFTRRFLTSVAGVAGVRSAAVASQLPFSGEERRGSIIGDGAARAEGEAIGVPYQTIVSAGYFGTMGIEILAGREFDARDEPGAARVVIADEALAALTWPDQDPLGRRFWQGEDEGDIADAYTVVGVVRAIRQNSLSADDAGGALYLPVAQSPLGFFRVVTKLDGEQATVWPQVHARAGSLDPELVLFWSDTMEGSIEASLILQRTPMQLLSLFGAIGLLLGTLGVYGVMAYSVGSRRREIGLRMAMGSTGWQVAQLIGREWSAVVGVGVALGVAGTFVSTRVIQSLLFETGPLDPQVLLGVLILVLAAAALACLAPVRRAVGVDSVTALREG